MLEIHQREDTKGYENLISGIEYPIIIEAVTGDKVDGYCIYSVANGEVFIHGMHIRPYEHGNIFNRDPMRPKKLLLHKREINRYFGLTKQQGLTLIPLSIYFNNSKVKIEVGLCKGKKLYDKRDDIAKKDQKREAERDFKIRNIG